MFFFIPSIFSHKIWPQGVENWVWSDDFAVEAELHKDSIFNVKTYYFVGFRPGVDQITKKLGGAIVENSKISPNKMLGPIFQRRA